MHVIKKWYLLMGLIFLVRPALVFAGGIHASLSRDTIQLGQTVTLSVDVSAASDQGSPDFSPLRKDFQLFGRSSSHSFSIVNGKRSMRASISIVLRAKHMGKIKIPSLLVDGAHTNALLLTVTPPVPVTAGHRGKRVFIEVSATPHQAYVGQQIAYVVRLYYDISLVNGTMNVPQLSDVHLEPIGADIKYDDQRGGHRYHVIERRYALFPQKAGVVHIPALQFQGLASSPNASTDPGSVFGIFDPFSAHTRVSAMSPALTLQVKEPPKAWGSSDWLPARQLTLALNGLPANGTIRVGTVLNLHLSVQADGLAASALPTLSLPDLPGATVYPDHPVDETGRNGIWLHGKRTRGFAVVLQHPGTLTIPVTTLKWFNVQTGQISLARIPAHRFTVLPAIQHKDTTTASSPPPIMAKPVTAVALSRPGSSERWRLIALISLTLLVLLLLLLLIVWWWRARNTSGSDNTDIQNQSAASKPNVAKQAFIHAAASQDIAQQARTLLAWARTERAHLRNLGELSLALAASEQHAAIAYMQQHQYAQVTDTSTVDIAQAFVNGFAWRDATSSDPNVPLPPLYPFDLEQS